MAESPEHKARLLLDGALDAVLRANDMAQALALARAAAAILPQGHALISECAEVLLEAGEGALGAVVVCALRC